MNKQEENMGEEVNGNVANASSNRGLDANGNERNPEDLEKQIARRNKRLTTFFELAELPVKIIGDDNAPAIIYKGKVLNAYVHNFYLRFTDKSDNGNIIYEVKLAHEQKFDKNKIMECINDYPMRSVHQILLRDTKNQLRLAGYNYLNRKESLGRYPVFATYSNKFYFKEEVAKEAVNELINEGYDCMVVLAPEE